MPQIDTSGYWDSPPPKKSKAPRVVLIVLGLFLLLFAGGCAAFIIEFRASVPDLFVNFDNAIVVDDVATCETTGLDFADDYTVEVTLTASSAQVQSHYEVIFSISDNGSTLGEGPAVLRDMAPGETRTEEVFNTIDSVGPASAASCRVVKVSRVDA